MQGITKLSITQVDPYCGPHAIEGVRFRAVRDAIGVSSWGMNVLELDPHCENYPEHDHAEDAQEEVYLVLEGRAELRVGDQSWPLVTGDMVRVGPEHRRKIVTADEGVRFLALGGTPGKAYAPGIAG